MTPFKLAMLWLSGDTPFRPRWLAQVFVVRVALRDPVKAAGIVAELNNGSRHLSCGPAFVAAMEGYRKHPRSWTLARRQECLRQRNIDNMTRGRPEYPRLP